MSALRWPAFVQQRWHGQVALTQLFWMDLIAVATVLNVFVGFASLMLLAQRADWWWVLVLHALIIPYNLFLTASVWRHPGARQIRKLTAAAWFLGMLAI